MIYDNVKKLCEESGISIFTLETQLGIGNGTIGRWKDSKPLAETLKKVADYFHVSMEDLMKETYPGDA